MGIKLNKYRQRFKRLGCEWYYIKKKKDEYKNTFYPNTEKVNRCSCDLSIKRKFFRDSLLPCPQFMAISIIPLLGPATCAPWLEVNAGH